MVYVLAKACQESDNKTNFTPERKIHKKRSDAIRTPEFVDVVDVDVTSWIQFLSPMVFALVPRTTLDSWMSMSNLGWTV